MNMCANPNASARFCFRRGHRLTSMDMCSDSVDHTRRSPAPAKCPVVSDCRPPMHAFGDVSIRIQSIRTAMQASHSRPVSRRMVRRVTCHQPALHNWWRCHSASWNDRAVTMQQRDMEQHRVTLCMAGRNRMHALAVGLLPAGGCYPPRMKWCACMCHNETRSLCTHVLTSIDSKCLSSYTPARGSGV